MSDIGPNVTFLERRTYRRRRLIDCARLLPLMGLWLWLVPVLWQGGGAQGADAMKLSSGLIYVFAVWAGLVLAGATLVVLLSLVASRAPTDPSDEAQDGDA